ncbi:SGNH_hydro domain-containing protein [Podarcis lilfordi]|uniref:Platelet-activating factor acetylhydrolase IB subunit alpha2 n=1 Tax=Podarcis lilfordi TaxID=74358 RepID=A0AA35LFN6_9SAUR|nr:SGNH_hydro domain-containing protein [Podarcis lilfordi]
MNPPARRIRPRDRMSQGDSNPAAIPHAAEDVQGDDRWMSQHNRFVLDCKDKEPDVLFVGDSMVQLLQQYEIWRELFSPLHALNFGIGGDTTGQVLWRLKNGELENIKPKVIVVWVGTNNHENTAEEVAGGIEAIVRLINTRQPQAKIIVLVCIAVVKEQVATLGMCALSASSSLTRRNGSSSMRREGQCHSFLQGCFWE